jgi:hypothetical protein
MWPGSASVVMIRWWVVAVVMVVVRRMVVVVMVMMMIRMMVVLPALQGVQYRLPFGTAETGHGVPARSGVVPAVVTLGDVAKASLVLHALVKELIHEANVSAEAPVHEREQTGPQWRHRAGAAKDDRSSVETDSITGRRIGVTRHVRHSPAVRRRRSGDGRNVNGLLPARPREEPADATAAA